MASYTTSQDAMPHPPGSYPADTSTTAEDPGLILSGSRRPQDSNVQAGTEKVTRGHMYKDSGIGLEDESKYSNPTFRAHEPVPAEGAYNVHNNNAVLKNRDTVAATVPATAGSRSDHQDQATKPGMLSSTYGGKDDKNGGHAIPKPATYNGPSMLHDTAKGLSSTGPATDTASASANTPSGSESRSGSDGNIIRSGLGQKSTFENEEPYWGDIAHGTGIYNTVTGHGSSETPVGGSVHTRDLPSVAGQRQPNPPTSSDATTRDEAAHPPGSRFKEGIAASSAVAGAGTAGSMIARGRDKPGEDSVKEPAPRKYNEAEVKKEGRLASLFHRDHHNEKGTGLGKIHRGEEGKSQQGRKPSQEGSHLASRDAGSAAAAATVAVPNSSHDVAEKHDKKDREFKLDNNHGANKLAKDKKTRAQPQGFKDPFLATGYAGPNSQNPTMTTENAPLPTGNTHSLPTSGIHTNHPGVGDSTSNFGAGGHPLRDTYNKPVSEGTTGHDNKAKTSHIGAKTAATGAGLVGTSLAATHSLGGRKDGDRDRIARPSNTSELAGNPIAGPVHQPQLATANPDFDSHTHGSSQRMPEPGTSSGMDIGAGHHLQTSRSGYEPAAATSSISPTDTSFNNSARGSSQRNGLSAATTAAGAAGVGAGAIAHRTGRGNNDLGAGNGSSSNTKGLSAAGTSEPPPNAAAKATSAGMGRHSLSPSSGASAHSGKYNVLASGTPSGINLEERARDHIASAGQPQHCGTGAAGSRMRVPPTAEPVSTGQKGGGAAVSAATAAAGAGIGAGVGALRSQTGRIMHRCARCGAEEDISGYLHQGK
ncbi:hypothetical protein GGS23DRAFT_608771 [Durotheca rogersii]|uniref:uncharacterized protein n=1 Tax=Durotheca rogersii TaxID=419775 RepID=UPI00221FEE9F|nr:uncharacterized protein GGS23DRAFT_608771 [Durotheca rogersii]KAI5868191.1 hypothetical protein GGS23DRAFT_608771 [Durotheca rogersii]